MYKVVKSTDAGLDELEIDRLEKGCWIDVVAPSEEELQEIAAATKIQMDFLTAPLDEEEKSRIEIEDDQILILVDIPFLRSNKDYDTLPLGIIITENCITTVCLEPNAVTAEFGAHTKIKPLDSGPTTTSNSKSSTIRCNASIAACRPSLS